MCESDLSVFRFLEVRFSLLKYYTLIIVNYTIIFSYSHGHRHIAEPRYILSFIFL